jgi:hypothetical protein
VDASIYGAVIWTVAIVLLVIAVRRKTRARGRRTGSVGPGAIGPIYEMLNEDKRNAIEIILEERAEARDPEHKDGVLPNP